MMSVVPQFLLLFNLNTYQTEIVTGLEDPGSRPLNHGQLCRQRTGSELEPRVKLGQKFWSRYTCSFIGKFDRFIPVAVNDL